MISAAVDWNAVEAIGTSAGAVLTAATLVVALTAMTIERRARRADVARLDALREDAEAAQTSLVVVGDLRADLGSGRTTLTMSNYSQRPVFDVQVSLILNGHPLTPTDGRAGGAPVRPVLHPGERVDLELNAPFGEEALVAARMELRDSMGLRWRRDNNGRPQRLLDD